MHNAINDRASLQQFMNKHDHLERNDIDTTQRITDTTIVMRGGTYTHNVCIHHVHVHNYGHNYGTASSCLKLTMRAQTALSCMVELSWKERIESLSMTPPSTSFCRRAGQIASQTHVTFSGHVCTIIINNVIHQSVCTTCT